MSAQSGEVQIDGVRKLRWGRGKENTFMGALYVTLRAVGVDVTYDDLMGWSGAAFRLHFHQPNWCPSSPDATCGFDHSQPAFEALGYTAELHQVHDKNPEDVKKNKEVAMASVDRKVPVIGSDLIASMDWGVITGYINQGEKFLCRTYWDKTEHYAVAERWPWRIYVLDKKTDPPERMQTLRRSLEIAVELARTKSYGRYASGLFAYQCWVDNLLDESRFEGLYPETLDFATCTNGWCYTSLEDARGAATRYLRSILPEFEGAQAKSLAKADRLYMKVYESLCATRRCAPQPWQMQEGEHWTHEMRQMQAEVLRKIGALEEQAVAAVEAALS